MKKSKLIALASIATAFSVIFMVIGAFIPALDYSCIFLASICMMLPLSKESKLGAFLSYLATSLLSLIMIGGVSLQVIIPFIMFFGLHPLVNYFQIKKNINKYLSLIVKDVWFVGSLLLVNLFFKDFIIVETDWLEKYINYIIIFGGGSLFIVYDILMLRFQKAINIIVKRLKL